MKRDTTHDWDDEMQKQFEKTREIEDSKAFRREAGDNFGHGRFENFWDWIFAASKKRECD